MRKEHRIEKKPLVETTLPIGQLQLSTTYLAKARVKTGPTVCLAELQNQILLTGIGPFLGLEFYAIYAI